MAHPMMLKVTFLLKAKPGSFSVRIDGHVVPAEQWEEGWANQFTYSLNCEAGKRLAIHRTLTGVEGDTLSLKVTVDEWDLDLGTYSLSISNGTKAEDDIVVTVPEPMFRMRGEEGMPMDGASPDDESSAPPAYESKDFGEAMPPLPQSAPMPSAMRGPHTTTKAFHKSEEGGNYEVDVFYATDRNAIEKDRKLGYGAERSKLQYGKCVVNIPKNKAMGDLPRPVWWKLQFHEDPDKHVMVLETVAKDKESFFAELKATVAQATEMDAFVFIHGYNVSFEESAWRTAQIAYDTGFGGAPIMYSWPSRASVEGYFSDEDNVQYSHQSIVQFIKDVKERSGAHKLHLIAHSMGNRALTSALVSLHESAYFKETCFNQIILAAPDIDAQIFINDIAPNLTNCSSRVTLYASSKDKALMASRKLRENMHRVGDGGADIVCCAGIDTVDASSVDTDLLGHGYFADTLPLLHDITELLDSGKGPDERKLTPVKDEDRSYWSF
jgi:esterase/lipase superfamily enzyme